MYHKDFDQLRNVALENCDSNSVVIFSIGSKVNANDQFQGNEQMQPPFADQLALSGKKVTVINIDSFAEDLSRYKIQPALQHAQSHYIDYKLQDSERDRQLISDVIATGAKVILIDNTSKYMKNYTISVAQQHSALIHNQLEVLHRYIAYDGGIAVQYHNLIFSGPTDYIEMRIAEIMEPANNGDQYASISDSSDPYLRASNSKKCRQYWIDHQAEHQDKIKKFGNFYAKGLIDIKAEHLFCNAPMSEQTNSQANTASRVATPTVNNSSAPQENANNTANTGERVTTPTANNASTPSNPVAKTNTTIDEPKVKTMPLVGKIFLGILIALTFPISLPILGIVLLVRSKQQPTVAPDNKTTAPGLPDKRQFANRARVVAAPEVYRTGPQVAPSPSLQN